MTILMKRCEQGMTNTNDDLKAAFAGESQAKMKYLAFAQKAEEEGYLQVAKVFRAAAEAETVHAINHLKVMNGIGGTEENLREAVKGENYEHTTMYPGFIETAKKESNKDALRSFTFANKAEQVHEKRYRAAAEAVMIKRDLPGKKLFVCPICGNIEEGEAPDHCQICGSPGSTFKEIL
jgi:rubrerythrin